MRRRRMDDAGIDRSTAQADQQESDERNRLSERQQHDGDSPENDGLPHADHLTILQLHGDEATDPTPDRDTDAEHAGKRSRRSSIDALREMQIAACPQHGGLLHAAVAEKAEHDGLCAWNRENIL